MICPRCQRFTPDQGFKCMNCGSIIEKKDLNAQRDQAVPFRRGGPSLYRSWMLIPLVLLAILAYLFFTQKNKSHAVNTHDPGLELEIETYLQKGKINIVDFFSDYCPPCQQISPLLRKLDEQRPDLVVLAVDINRKGVKGIDFFSPLARQYQLNAVPHFKIFDVEGNLVSEGQAAHMEVFRLLSQAGIQ